MNSKDALITKVDELQKQAEEIEELGVKLLEEAPFNQGDADRRGGYFSLVDYNSPLRKRQREAILKYQQWYSTSLHLIDEYAPQWLDDFKEHYSYPDNSLSVGVIQYLNLGI